MGEAAGSKQSCTVDADASALANAVAPQLPAWDCAMDLASVRVHGHSTLSSRAISRTSTLLGQCAEA